MLIPDNKIIEIRKKMYQYDRGNFDDICFTLFSCPSCGSESMDLTLLPIVEKEKCSDLEIKRTQELTLKKIFNADFDFLHEKGNCNCTKNSTLNLKRIIYCYNQGVIDYQNYIDYPFESIDKFQFNLLETNTSKTFLFFDTETTGLPKNWKASYKDLNNWPRLVQVAWIIADINGRILEQNNYIIKPIGFSIPEDAIKVHKISTQQAMSKGQNLNFVLSKFNDCVNNSDIIVAHNLKYDLNVIASEMFRLNIDSDIIDKECICTMESTIDFCKLPGNYGYKYPSLSELHQKLFYSTFDEAHDASVDIKATYKCFYELLKNKTIKL